MAIRVGNKGYQSEINITPYIDILLVLLIIFMTTAPMQRHDHPVRVPQPPSAEQQKKPRTDSLIIEMDLERKVKLNKEPITLEKLEATLTEFFSRSAVKDVFIRGDASLPYGEIFPLLDIARRSGANNIALLKMNTPAAPENAQASR
ncbi:MAG: biopolymer transporter ExbD [Acidobacteria bacterium]|nr:biopolymer transporter ExbD [Acidobacteriota bacterium]